ncbi:E3 ubiquitin-protein ligase TRIM58-like isoform X2 [Triplophysa dalaica]|uniref:E3 ubiquitin-protein ligase TRIM58-like isoform X2 n=1 Tax=Triplophysa dalaica TaxID=1582913 RepID=UPI0024DFA5D6|nr:E3 ubiquitin-protein ligase TRIM58-like isoform X2 [Triplophysa dalaica]
MAEFDVELFSEQELTCSICLEIFTEPVSTPCGHNFCQSCIGGYWASSSVCTCPLCKRPFGERPELCINRVFAHIAQKYKEKRYGEPPKPKARQISISDGVSPSDVDEQIFCDICSGKKQKAVSSCLTCTASYCEIHVLPHHQTSFYSSHRLLDPHEALRGRTCPQHGRLLEVYCRTDEKCICAICVLEEHRTHTTVSIQTERAYKQRLLGKTELNIQMCIERRSVDLNELKSKLQILQSVDRIRSELVGGIQEKQESVIGRGQRMVSQLESKLSELRERKDGLEAQAVSEDHINFLKSFEEMNRPVQDTHDELEEDLTLHFSLRDVKRALGEIRERLDDISCGQVHHRGSVSGVAESESMTSVQFIRRKDHWSLKDLRRIKTGHRKIKGFLEDISLNPVTAYPFLILSDDRKQLKRGEKLQFYRNSVQRFDVWSCVLAKEGFESGRHYWEVNVGENKDWKLGVVRESSQRKGLFDMSPASGYYTIWWSGNHLRALTAPPPVKIKVSGRLRRVGVYLDCDERQIIFYNAKTGSELYSYTTVEFSEKMFPLFGTGDKDIPLVLMSVSVSVPE